MGIALDLVGPLPRGEMVLVSIDYYSRYTEVFFLRSTAVEKIASCLRELFTRLGERQGP